MSATGSKMAWSNLVQAAVHISLFNYIDLQYQGVKFDNGKCPSREDLVLRALQMWQTGHVCSMSLG